MEDRYRKRLEPPSSPTVVYRTGIGMSFELENDPCRPFYLLMDSKRNRKETKRTPDHSCRVVHRHKEHKKWRRSSNILSAFNLTPQPTPTLPSFSSFLFLFSTQKNKKHTRRRIQQIPFSHIRLSSQLADFSRSGCIPVVPSIAS